MTKGQPSSRSLPPGSVIVPRAFSSSWRQTPSVRQLYLKSTGEQRVKLTQYIVHVGTMTMKQATLLENWKGAFGSAQCRSWTTLGSSPKSYPERKLQSLVLMLSLTSMFSQLLSMTGLDIMKCYFFRLKRTCSGPSLLGFPVPPLIMPFHLWGFFFFLPFFFFFYCWIYKILWNMLFPDVGPKCPVIYFLSKPWADEITQVWLYESTHQCLH